ncbi:MAG TPA: alpha/beta hydrolase-fold protein [Puia sp.]|nr:alpha/beta hydrolase-fold protein [Puia sp.]
MKNYEDYIYLAHMEVISGPVVVTEHMVVESLFLAREVWVDIYAPAGIRDIGSSDLLLINDGQDLPLMRIEAMLEELYSNHRISPMVIAGIHAGPDRKDEYGTAGIPDYMGRGARAGAYTAFVLEELVPALSDWYQDHTFKSKSIAGFSLGALSALDILWHHPKEFVRAGLFSGSFWWRSKDKTDAGYDENVHRIMHGQIAAGSYYPGLRFFFECGTEDEREDRNGNGVIDSIDDTLDLIGELVKKGYEREKDICYIEVPGGRHDVATWAQVMPAFLQWLNEKPG